MEEFYRRISEWLDCNEGEDIAVSDHGVGRSMTCIYKDIKYEYSFSIFKIMSFDGKNSLSINTNRIIGLKEFKDIKSLIINFDSGEEVGLCFV